MKCLKCGSELGKASASMSGGIMGDEYIESFFYCNKCNVYTVEVFHDRFLGEEDVHFRGPVPKKEGDKKVALMKKCKDPMNKKCRCDAHKEYFGGMLD